MAKAVLILLVLGSLAPFAHGQTREQIVVFGSANFNSSSAALIENVKMNIQIYSLRKALEKINPDLEVRYVKVGWSGEILDELQNHSNPLRAIVFFGHGNTKTYALNEDDHFSGKTLANLLRVGLAHRVLGQTFTVYMAGCKMGGEVTAGLNFQNNLFEKLSAMDELTSRTKLEVIAHENSPVATNYGQPSKLDRFFLSRQVGPIVKRYNYFWERITSAVGYAPFAPLVGTSIGPIIGAFVAVANNDIRYDVAGLGIGALSYVGMRSAGFLAKSRTQDQVQSGTSYDLLRDSLRCEKLLEP